MKKIIVIMFSITCFMNCANCQLNKQNWLMGGSGEFSSDKTRYSPGEITSTQLTISPKVGYFIVDKLALGVYGNVGTVTSKSNNIKTRYTTFGIGPFLRYYLLAKEKNTNLLIEASGAFNQQSNSSVSSKSTFYSYGLMAGPEIFFNTSVGIEILIGYKGYSEAETNVKNNGFHINIGFQLHLEKNN